MAREYLTVSEYSHRYDIPKTNIYRWIRLGKLKARKDANRMLIPEGQKIPVKDPSKHGWYYTWKERD